MENKGNSNKLIISFFGGLSIKSPSYEFVATAASSTQTALLIASLLTNMGMPVSKSSLMQAMWPEDINSDLSGALRTAVYRARKELANFYPDEKYEYIKFSQDAYFWNTDIPCEIDIIEFDNLCSQSKKEHDPDKKYLQCVKLMELYKGDFLPNQTYVEFVLYRNTYFRNQFLQAAIFMCDYLLYHEKYEEVISVCDRALLFYQEDERIYANKIKALVETDRAEQALDYYNSISHALSHKLGISVSPAFANLYNLIIKKLPYKRMDILNLEDSLSESEQDSNSYYCDYNMFKNFYQISKRSVRRSFTKRYLVLFTIIDKESPDFLSDDVRTGMDLMFTTIAKCLRKNDVFTRTSDWQYSVILTVPNESGANTAVTRLVSQFKKANSNKNIRLEFTSKLID